MNRPRLPARFIRLCKSVKAKRPRTVINHILKHGFVTTQDLKEKYGYSHPPRAARDVREHGIPLVTSPTRGRDGRKIAEYRFGNPEEARPATQRGRMALSKELKRSLIGRYGARCAIYCVPFPERELQIDHRIPFEVLGDDPKADVKIEDYYMLLCGSANRAKSWSCEHCVNWRESKKPEVCRTCYWAYPEDYTHVAMRPVRRADILWNEGEVADYDRLKRKTERLQKNIPAYVKEIVRKHLSGEGRTGVAG